MMRRDPRAVRCVDWWERTQHEFYQPEAYFPNGFALYFADAELPIEEEIALYQDVSDEYWERAWSRSQEPSGMVITDFERIPDDEAA